MAVESMWGKVPIARSECFEWKIPNLSFCVSAEDDEWHLVVDRNPNTRTVIRRKRTKLIDGEVKRFVTVVEDELTLLPVLPDKPVVIRPDGPVALLPGRSATFSFTVPLWIGFCGGSKTGDTVFHEEPTTQLSNTWIGDITAGEMCYALDTHLLRTPHESYTMWEALCAIQVKNGSSEKLDFTRLCVHVENLELFEADNRFTTNSLDVTFKGTEQESQIVISSEPPVKSARKIRDARVSFNRNIIRKTFDVLRVVTGI